MNWPASCERSGQYLSPEPLLQDPEWVRDELRSGHQVPVYAYARNNPIANVDRNGLSPGAAATVPFFIPWSPTAAAFTSAAGTAAGAGLMGVGALGVGAVAVGANYIGVSQFTYAEPAGFSDADVAARTGPLVCRIGPKTLEETCNEIKGAFVAPFRRECERRTGNWDVCRQGCREEGEEIRQACLRNRGA